MQVRRFTRADGGVIVADIAVIRVRTASGALVNIHGGRSVPGRPGLTITVAASGRSEIEQRWVQEEVEDIYRLPANRSQKEHVA